MMTAAGFVVVAALANAGAMELCASHVAPQSGQRLQTAALKGVELYSWRTAEGPRFALLWGTNRSKTEREIKSPTCALSGVSELKASLARLAAGELVSWSNLEDGHSLTLRPAPAELVAELTEYAHTIGIRMQPLW